MKNNTSKLYVKFCRFPKLFDMIHEFFIYTFDGIDKENNKCLMSHTIMGKGFIYDYHTKHTCMIDDAKFIAAMENRFFNGVDVGKIENGDMMRFANFVFREDKSKVSYIVLTSPIGEIKSKVFYTGNQMYDLFKEFDPREQYNDNV